MPPSNMAGNRNVRPSETSFARRTCSPQRRHIRKWAQTGLPPLLINSYSIASLIPTTLQFVSGRETKSVLSHGTAKSQCLKLSLGLTILSFFVRTDYATCVIAVSFIPTMGLTSKCLRVRSFDILTMSVMTTVNLLIMVRLQQWSARQP